VRKFSKIMWILSSELLMVYLHTLLLVLTTIEYCTVVRFRFVLYFLFWRRTKLEVDRDGSVSRGSPQPPSSFLSTNSVSHGTRSGGWKLVVLDVSQSADNQGQHVPRRY